MTVNNDLYDEKGRVIRPILFNTAKDGSGTWYIPITNSDGVTEVILAANSGVDIGDVDIATIAAGTNIIGKVGIDQTTDGTTNAVHLTAGTNRVGTVSGVLKEVRVSQDIDGSLGAYTAGDVVGADDCCTTLAITWQFDVARATGGYGYIVGATLFNETENQAVQYDLLLFNATPTGELRDNAANDNPLKADSAKWIGRIEFPSSVAKGATVATTTQATPSTAGRLPMPFKCATGDTKIYGVLVTNTAYTQTATDTIEIGLIVEQY